MKASLLLAVIAALLPAAISSAALAQPAGAAASPAGVEVRLGEWTDAARGGRVVPYKLYMPRGAGPFPVVIHSHGLGGSREASTYILQAVADAGFIVVALQHAGSDSGLLMGGVRPGDEAGLVAAGRAGMTPEAARARYGDVPFAIDQIARDRLGGRADMSRIGMSGHSFGALSTLTAVGQRIPLLPNDTSYMEPRIKAAIAYSPNKPRGDDPRAALARVKTPMLHFTGTEDATPFDQEKTPFERTTPFQAIQGADQFLVILDGADHALFGGRRVQLGRLKPIDPPQMEIVKAETVRFWKAYLRGDAAALKETCDLPKRIAGAGTGYVKAARCGPATPIAPVEGLR
ncbi:MAG: dienelactone hydrolase family protein [Phenylobacterium sp.]|uniref:alpha/beta hydrolase family protein n=1 Tax=Phenylobacterium sp. TaxID=1871053 RepID=UPI001A53D6B7|nr:dienelactone hydrolase family protein [Phenylobacterium sp.]MBL8772068.1 dienelactone hydrolase family protein [Phenylobacterium sp.]